MRITRLALLAAPLMLLACDREPAAPEVDVAPSLGATSDWLEDDYTIPANPPYYAPCIDDYVVEQGTVHRRRHRVIQDDGAVLIRWQVWPGDDYVVRGTATGDWYPVSGFHNKIITTLKVGVHQSWTLHYVVENATTGMVLDWPVRSTFILNANGEITVDRFVEPCTVRH
jgi:hypothetical protein